MNKTLDDVVCEIGKKLAYNVREQERADAIYDWMINHILYDYERKKAIDEGRDQGVPFRPQQTIDKRMGVCSDMAVLYVALARKLGLQAQYARVMRDHKGERVNHACAIVNHGEEILQVDPAYKLRNARHLEYNIEEPEALKGDDSKKPQAFSLQFPNLGTKLFEKFAIPGITATIAGVIMYIIGTYIGPAVRYRHIQHEEINCGAQFSTKNGTLRYGVAPEAHKTWKEALFFKEAKLRNLFDHELLDALVQSDKDADNTISQEEARDARESARSAYTKSKR